MENLMEEGSTSGKMGPLTKDFSWMAWDKARGIGQVRMEINTKEIIVLIAKMDLDNSDGWMEIFIRGISARTPDKGMARCFGAMEVFMKGNGAEGFQMEKVLNMLTKQGMFKAKG